MGNKYLLRARIDLLVSFRAKLSNYSKGKY